jgi:hypothetical protein
MLEIYPFSLTEALSSFFKQATIQLIAGAEEKALGRPSECDVVDKDSPEHYAILFVGETFSRIIRRGSTGLC